MFAPSQLNEIDDGIPVRSYGRRWGGTSPLIRFRILRSGPLSGGNLIVVCEVSGGGRSVKDRGKECNLQSVSYVLC